MHAKLMISSLHCSQISLADDKMGIKQRNANISTYTKQYWETFELVSDNKNLFQTPFWNSVTVNTEEITGPPFKTPMHGIMHKDNPYLVSGYRIMPTNNYINCAKSVFFMHNETVNFWTHCVPAISWILIGLWVLPELFAEYDFMDAFMFFVHILGCFCVFTFSSVYHMFKCNSVKDYHWFVALDFSGILSIIGSGNAFGPYFDYTCYPGYRTFLVSTAIIAGILLAALVPMIVKYRLTVLRTGLFVAYAFFGLFCWLFKAHVLESGQFENEKYETFGSIILMYVLSCSAMVIRNLKYPERWKPRIFDNWGASHQIFHVLTALSSYPVFFTYYTLFKSGYFRYACR